MTLICHSSVELCTSLQLDQLCKLAHETGRVVLWDAELRDFVLPVLPGILCDGCRTWVSPDGVMV